MPITHYGVLKGKAIRRLVEHDDQTPHYEIMVETGDATLRASINVRSAVDDAELFYRIDDDFTHPIVERVDALPLGFTALPSEPSSGALDYVRGHLVDRRRFRVTGTGALGSGELPDLLDLYVNAAIATPDATVYAFGSRWGPKPYEIDRTFRDRPIQPSDGIHEIHMNQGNINQQGPYSGNLYRENGTWQDGGLIIQFPSEERWVGIFLAFQAQVWHTDDRTGHPRLSSGEIEFRVLIVAALVNPVGPSPEAETVTLLNPGRDAIDLHGWAILNSDQHPTHLHGHLAPYETIRFSIAPGAPLRNRVGTITLVDNRGLKVDGVAYTTRDAQREGWLMTF